MAIIRTLILRAPGTNCDRETEHAWMLAGATAERVHVRRLIERPSLLDAFQILTIPGGFSYGDDIGAGRVLAAQLERALHDELRAFVDAGKLALGICNGFQVLVRAGLLPDPSAPLPQRACAVTYNDPPGFQDRWVTLEATSTQCVFLETGLRYEMPIAHGEGRVVFADRAVEENVDARQLAALRYVRGERDDESTPANPNGSAREIAGLCDATGRILGLMPHPERFVRWTQHPCWTSLPERDVADGLRVFHKAATCLA